MAHWLNNKLALLILCVFAGNFLFAQIGTEPTVYKDYKDPEQFEKFYKRRKLVGAWQIHELKKGALVVKLKTEKPLIDGLLKNGNRALAEKKRLERLAINLNVYKAYIDNYKFSKVYFIYSSSGDSLLKGKRTGMFLDTNLNVDPTITLNESFYLIAETDNLYNSSIGFVPEDSAMKVFEKGSATVSSAPIVVKNKYGHQLKNPFPYSAGYGLITEKSNSSVSIYINNILIPFNITGTNAGTSRISYKYEGNDLVLKIPKIYTYKWFCYAVQHLNYNLEEYYRGAPLPENAKLESVKPFLY